MICVLIFRNIGACLVCLRQPFSEILLGTSISSFSSRKSITLYFMVLSESIALIKVLACTTLLLMR